jgi:hypothetical protein
MVVVVVVESHDESFDGRFSFTEGVESRGLIREAVTQTLTLLSMSMVQTQKGQQRTDLRGYSVEERVSMWCTVSDR